jgi:hypothetical protein
VNKVQQEDVMERNESERAATEQVEDAAHRQRMTAELGHAQCICREYAAITASLHPDCPEHGYVPRPRRR